MSKELRYITGYAVIRVDEGPVDVPCRVPEIVVDGVALPTAGPLNVQVKEIVMSEDEARSEVMRLNVLNGENGCAYYWQTTHIFIDGGSHGSNAAST
jgi:hypothetical protein